MGWIASLLVTVLLAAACGGGDDSSNGNDGGNDSTDGTAVDLPECPLDALEQWDPAADGRIEVVVWHSLVAKTADTLTAMAADYNASQDKVTVSIESQGQSYEELLRKYNQGIPTGDLPGIALLEDTVTQYMADSGTILPGQSCFDASGISLDDFVPVAVDYYTVDGAFLPVALSPSTNLLYYNRSHFEQAGLDPDDPPSTLDEVRAAAEAIKEAGVVEEPLVMQMQPWFVEHWLTGAKAPVVDNDNGRGDAAGASAGAFDNESTAEIFEWLQGMEADGLMNPVPGTEGQVEHYFAMALGQSSMTFETSTAATSIAAFLEGDLDTSEFGVTDTADTGALDIDAAPYPGLTEPGKVGLGGGVWYVTNATAPEVQAASWDFARWFDEPTQQVRWNIEGSYLPWNLAAADDPELQAFWSDETTGQWLSTAYDQLLSSDPAWPGPLIGPYDDTRIAIRDALDAMILADEAAADAISTADGEITDAIERYNDENF